MKPPQLMGILNITPDSFSDGGQAFDAASALQKFMQLVTDGADIIDVGAESTRPGATPLSADEEWARLAPVLSAIAAHPLRKTVRISIDTRHAATAMQALALGVDSINDVSGLRDGAMRRAVAASSCRVIVMHSLSLPARAGETLPEDADPIVVIQQWKQEVTSLAAASGIAVERLMFDPGIGFGKTAQQSLALLERAGDLVAGGGEWLYGHSRKSCYRALTRDEKDYLAQRDTLTLDYSRKLAYAGVACLRVHEVAAHRAMLEQLCT